MKHAGIVRKVDGMAGIDEVADVNDAIDGVLLKIN